MDSRKRTARMAGGLYLVVVVTGIFSLGYVPSKLIVDGNASATFANIVASETLFRLGILAGIVCYVFFLFLPTVLYKLLNEVNKTYAIAMVLLAVVSVPISLINLTNKMAVLTWISKAEYLGVFGEGNAHAQVLLHLDYYSNGIKIASIFWGLWLLPFGYLVFKSGFLPKIFGILLMAGCFGYLANFTGNFLFKNYSDLGVSTFVSLPASLGEIGICLWLLVIGAKNNTALSSNY